MVDGPDSAWRNRAPGPHRNTARQAMDGLWTEARGQQKQSNDPHNNQHNPQYANYWAPLTRKRHIPPHPAQPRHTNNWAPRTRKRHQQEHRPQRPTERSDPTQHAKGRTGDRPGPRKEATTRRNVTRGGGGHGSIAMAVHRRRRCAPPPPPPQTKGTIAGQNEVYNREDLAGPLLVHTLLGPRLPQSALTNQRFVPTVVALQPRALQGKGWHSTAASRRRGGGVTWLTGVAPCFGTGLPFTKPTAC